MAGGWHPMSTTESIPVYWAYNGSLPRLVAEIIGRAVAQFARANEADQISWYRDLPMWRVIERCGERTNQAIVESVVLEDGAQIAVSPEAYIDRGVIERGVFTQTRIFVQPAERLGGRKLIPTAKLHQLAKRQPEQAAAKLTAMLAAVLDTARSSEPSDVHQWEGHYPGAPLVAIDGPAASGKSAVGTRVAAVLKLPFVDTGAMYRAITWLALQRGIAPTDAEALGALARSATMEVSPPPEDGSAAATIVIDGLDATRHLREPAVERAVSPVSAVPAVREVMVHLQRQAAGRGIVMAGRDIGTVVLPTADVKVFLDASLDVRVRRRLEESQAKGSGATAESVAADLRGRDSIDSSRAVAPLRPAEDATVIATDTLSIDEVVDRILELVARV